MILPLKDLYTPLTLYVFCAFVWSCASKPITPPQSKEKPICVDGRPSPDGCQPCGSSDDCPKNAQCEDSGGVQLCVFLPPEIRPKSQSSYTFEPYPSLAIGDPVSITLPRLREALPELQGTALSHIDQRLRHWRVEISPKGVQPKDADQIVAQHPVRDRKYFFSTDTKVPKDPEARYSVTLYPKGYKERYSFVYYRDRTNGGREILIPPKEVQGDRWFSDRRRSWEVEVKRLSSVGVLYHSIDLTPHGLRIPTQQA